MRKFEKSVLAVAVAAFAVACADPTMPDRPLVEGGISRLVTDAPKTWPFVGIANGAVELCKVSNVPGTFDFTVTVNGVPTPGSPVSVTAGGPCVEVYRSVGLNNAPSPSVVVITENALPAGWSTTINTTRFLLPNAMYDPPRLNDLEEPLVPRVTLYINADMARRTTFTNTFTETPTGPICDFITFGRLVTEVGNKKVVISGNAGGLNANGTIKGEFHIDANGVDNHVADILTYGPITSGPLSGPSFPNARMVTGIAKNGVSVELRLWDGGEPGKGTDRAYVKLNGVELFAGGAAPLIDQGNMQYHPNCRGPGEASVGPASTTNNGKKKG